MEEFTPTQHEISVALARKEYGVKLTAFNLRVLAWVDRTAQDAYSFVSGSANYYGNPLQTQKTQARY